MSPNSLSALRADQPGLKIVPVVYYRPAVAPRFVIESRPKASAAKTAVKIKLKIVSKKNGTPPSAVGGDFAGREIAGLWVEIRRTGHIK